MSKSGFATSLLAATWLAAVVGACAPATSNLSDPAGPRYGGPLPGPAPAHDGTVRVVSFNLEEGREIRTAIEILRDDPDLRGADIVLLQEMDAVGTEWIADALAMAWVYYPATLRDGRGFGNAVLSRWPIAEDEKLVLPHVSIFRGTQRAATVATVDVHGVPIRIYSVHLATPIDQSLEDRRAQMRAVLDHAATAPVVILGGDLNAASLGELAVERGFAWPTRDGPRTSLLGRLDHIFFWGIEAEASGAAGPAATRRDASDHTPVWALGRLPGGV